ncbi:MAG: TolC family protein [Candidatus Binataceae bacterium]
MSNPALCRYLKANSGAKFSTCPPQKWNLASLTLAGFYYNPAIAVAEARVREAGAAIITAGARPNPTIALGPQYEVRSSPNFVPWGLGMFSLSLPIQTAGKRGYRIAQAKRLAEAARIAAGESAWAIRSRIRAALLRYLLDARRSNLALATENEIAQTTALIAQRVKAGGASEPALNFALADLQNARVKAIQARARAPEDRSVLAAAVGVPVKALNGIRISWAGLDNPPSQQWLSATAVQRLALLNRLDLRRELAQYAAADDALKLEIARQYPNLNFPMGYSWEGGENLFELGPSLVLPVFNQNQGPIAQAEARRKEVAARFLALQAGIIAQSSAALAAYRGALAALAAARGAADFQAKRLDQVKRAVSAGESDTLALATARLEELAARQTMLESLADAQVALGRLEDSMQRPLDIGDAGSFAFPSAPIVNHRADP